MTNKAFPLTLAIAATLLCSRAAGAESWNYMAYTDGAPSGLGYISIEQKDGEYTFSMVAGKLNACIRNQLKASVERTEKAITITSIIALA